MSLPVEHTFTVTHEGQELSLTFTMPTMRQRTKIGLAEARMREGVPAENLDPLTRSLIAQLCYLTETVTSPDGISFNESTDPFLMNEVYQEVLGYESRFLGDRDPNQDS